MAQRNSGIIQASTMIPRSRLEKSLGVGLGCARFQVDWVPESWNMYWVLFLRFVRFSLQKGVTEGGHSCFGGRPVREIQSIPAPNHDYHRLGWEPTRFGGLREYP